MYVIRLCFFHSKLSDPANLNFWINLFLKLLLSLPLKLYSINFKTLILYSNIEIQAYLIYKSANPPQIFSQKRCLFRIQKCVRESWHNLYAEQSTFPFLTPTTAPARMLFQKVSWVNLRLTIGTLVHSITIESSGGAAIASHLLQSSTEILLPNGKINQSRIKTSEKKKAASSRLGKST